MTSLRLWSGGVPLDDLGVVGDDLQISTVFGDGGCGVDTITWSMSLPRGFAHPALQEGALIELRRGPLVLATVINDEPDVDEWRFTAQGLIHRPADFIAVNSAGTPTNNLKDAVIQAAVDGLEWKIPGDVPNVTVTLDSPDQVLTVADILNRYCAQNHVRWGISGGGWLRFYTDPSTTRWVLTPDAPSLPSARGQVTRLRVRYATSTDSSGNVATVAMTVVPDAVLDQKGVVYAFEDITGEGVLTEPQAKTYATTLLQSQAPQASFTSGVAVGPRQITTIGDTPLDGGEWMVALEVGEGTGKVRSTGWRNPDVGVNGMGFDWIPGSATWSKTSGLTITPLAMAPSTYGDIMASLRAGIQAAQGQATKALGVAGHDRLAALVTPESPITFGPTMPASAQATEPASLWVDGTTLYICTTSYASGGTMDDWTIDTDPRTRAMVFSNIAQAKQLADLLDGYQTTISASGPSGVASPTSRWITVPDWGSSSLSVSSTVAGAWQGNAAGGWDSASTSLDWVKQAFTQHIVGIFDYLRSNLIEAVTLRSTDHTMQVDLNNSKITFNSGTATITGYNFGIGIGDASSPIGGDLSAGHITAWQGISSIDDLSSNGNITSLADVYAYGSFYSPNSPPSSIAPNMYLYPTTGRIFLTSGSTRDLKYDIEQLDIDGDLSDDIDAYERCSIYSWHYRWDDAEARLMRGRMVEDMLEQGLRAYVDFGEDGEPLQPAWNQIEGLGAAAHQRNAKRITALEEGRKADRQTIAELRATQKLILARLAALEAS